MILHDVYECSRLMLWEHDREDYPYSCLGSGFMFEYKGLCAFATAKHAIGLGRKGDHLCISPDADKLDEFIHFRDQVTVRDPDQDDSDYADICILQMDDSAMTQNLRDRCAPLRLDQLGHGVARLGLESMLFVTGFPQQLQRVEYEARQIHCQRAILGAKYVEPASERGCHRLSFTDVDSVQDFNGLSGSPVFQLGRHADGATCSFAGMLIRASFESMVGSFVDARVLIRMLERITAK